MLSLATLTAYCRTTYSANTPAGEFALRVGQINTAFDAWLESQAIDRWAFVTACNPESRVLGDAANAARHANLLSTVRSAGWSFWPGEGRGDSSDWPAEQSLLIAGISMSSAREIGQAFGQHAVVLGRCGGPPALLFSDPKNVRSVLRDALLSDDPVVAWAARQTLIS